MKELHNKVNIVPVIAKSDTLTKKELLRLKQRVMDEINGHGIQVCALRLVLCACVRVSVVQLGGLISRNAMLNWSAGIFVVVHCSGFFVVDHVQAYVEGF